MAALAEDLLLLLLDDVSGKPRADSTSLDYALAGALLAELALQRRVELVQGPGLLTRDRVAVIDETATGDELLDAALSVTGERARSAERLVVKLSKGPRERLLVALEQRGIVHREASRILGIWPRERWPAQDATREHAIRQQLYDVLVVGTTPDDHAVALVALLAAIDEAHKLFEGSRPESKAVKERAKSIAEGQWPATAVRKAVQAAQTAAATAGGGAAAAASAGSS